MKVFKGAGVVVLFVVAIVGASLGGLAYRYLTADVRGVVDAEERITSGASRIQAYDKFFNLCSEVQTMKTSIETQNNLLDSSVEERERQRVRANIAGMEAQLARYVNQYNADASKDYTSARFKASNLPFELNIRGETHCR